MKTIQINKHTTTVATPMRGEVIKVANVAPPVSSILNAVGEHIRGYPHICALSFAASEEKKSAFHCRSGVRWMDSLSSDRTEEQNDYPLWQISYELLEVVWNLLETSLTDAHSTPRSSGGVGDKWWQTNVWWCSIGIWIRWSQSGTDGLSLLDLSMWYYELFQTIYFYLWINSEKF